MPLAFLREPLIEKLGWALVHFLWEGALIALLFGVANAALRRASANARYLLACGALALMVVSVAATFWRLDSAGAARAPWPLRQSWLWLRRLLPRRSPKAWWPLASRRRSPHTCRGSFAPGWPG